MRARLIITAILAALLAGGMMFSVHLMEAKEERRELYLQQTQQLQERSAELDAKEAELDALIKRYENGQTDGAAELEQLRQDLEELQVEKEELAVQLEQAISDVEAMRQQLENDEESDQSYYLEVYNALTEGLNKVKGYISGN